MRMAIVAALVAAMAGGCSSTQDPKLIARLQVEVRLGDLTGAIRSSELICRRDVTSGTGYLAFDQWALRACHDLTSNPEVTRFLISGPPRGRPCPELYGGPQRARITGTVRGRSVDRSIDRTNGCGIRDWELLELLLGPP